MRPMYDQIEIPPGPPVEVPSSTPLEVPPAPANVPAPVPNETPAAPPIEWPQDQGELSTVHEENCLGPSATAGARLIQRIAALSGEQP